MDGSTSRGGAEHAIGGAEVAAHEGDELPVGGVVDRLDTYDLRLKGMIALVHVLDELELRRSRTDHENLAGTLEGLGDLVEEVLLVGRVTPLRGLGRVPTDMFPRVNHLGIECLVIDVENLGFVVINPDGSV
jgi:hypothetical protein